MSKILSVIAGVAVLALLVAPAGAQDGGSLAAVTYWTVDPANTDQFEAGLKAHNQVHVDSADPVALLTWQVISGPRSGQYGRASFGHVWADFDEGPPEGDAEDSALHITPYIEAADSTIWRVMSDISNPPSGPSQVTRIREFLVRPGHARDFEQAVGKIHAAFSEQPDWPSYEWYALVDGGRVPTYAGVFSRDSWGGFAAGETSFIDAIRAKHGDAAEGILQAVGAATEARTNYTIVHRPDLSYLPAGGGE